jgi:uncharacterized Tic20 family protein
MTDTDDPKPAPPEVEAVPLSPGEARGPTIDMAPPQSSPPPRSPPPPLEPPIIGKASAPSRPWREHVWAAVCHLMLFLVIPTVFLGAVITFFVWQWKGKADAQVEDQGREALNFQINVAVLTGLLGLTCVAAPLAPIVWLVAIVYCVIAARHAANGESYRYPYILRVVTH